MTCCKRDPLRPCRPCYTAQEWELDLSAKLTSVDEYLTIIGDGSDATGNCPNKPSNSHVWNYDSNGIDWDGETTRTERDIDTIKRCVLSSENQIGSQIKDGRLYGLGVGFKLGRSYKLDVPNFMRPSVDGSLIAVPVIHNSGRGTPRIQGHYIIPNVPFFGGNKITKNFKLTVGGDRYGNDWDRVPNKEFDSSIDELFDTVKGHVWEGGETQVQSNEWTVRFMQSSTGNGKLNRPVGVFDILNQVWLSQMNCLGGRVVLFFANGTGAGFDPWLHSVINFGKGFGNAEQRETLYKQAWELSLNDRPLWIALTSNNLLTNLGGEVVFQTGKTVRDFVETGVTIFKDVEIDSANGTFKQTDGLVGDEMVTKEDELKDAAGEFFRCYFDEPWATVFPQVDYRTHVAGDVEGERQRVHPIYNGPLRYYWDGRNLRDIGVPEGQFMAYSFANADWWMNECIGICDRKKTECAALIPFIGKFSVDGEQADTAAFRCLYFKAYRHDSIVPFLTVEPGENEFTLQNGTIIDIDARMNDSYVVGFDNPTEHDSEITNVTYESPLVTDVDKTTNEFGPFEWATFTFDGPDPGGTIPPAGIQTSDLVFTHDQSGNLIPSPFTLTIR